MSSEVTGRWDDLVSRPEFRGHRVRITIVDQPPAEPDDWIESSAGWRETVCGLPARPVTAAIAYTRKPGESD